MLYFKHQELVDKYHVSLKTVHNWIAAAKQRKLELTLYEHGTRTYVANTPGNIAILKNLAEQGKKYRNSRHAKVVTPKPEFYQLYSRRQILDIISNINIHQEIPRQYNYIEEGAKNWDNWLKRLKSEESANILKSTLELIHTNLESLDLLLDGRSKVNVVDIGVGNALPVKELLGHLLQTKKLHRYIAIDISQSMLAIAKRNIRSWYGDEVKFEGYVRDITYERFDDLLVDDMLNSEATQTTNIVLILGGTLGNFRSYKSVLNVTYGSMGDGDFLVYTDKPDTEASRRYFDFSPKPGSSTLSPNHRYILDLLNIDDSLYEVEMGYSEQKRMRFIRIRLKSALTIKFKFEKIEREVDLEKGSTILLLRVWHMKALETISNFEESGFKLLHSSMTNDREYMLTVSGVDAKADIEL